MNLKLIIIYMLCLFLLVLLFLWWKTEVWLQKGKTPIADGTNTYAIVLGAKVNGKTPSRSLQYRLDAAARYANEHPQVQFILSGGQGPDEDITEAEAMKTYLLEKGIEENRLILEADSTSTYENILFSKRYLPSSTSSITIITSDYHLARAQKLAHEFGLQTDVVSAPTPNSIKWKAITRERLALLKAQVIGK